jgi:atypical dual specificity phosphatase
MSAIKTLLVRLSFLPTLWYNRCMVLAGIWRPWDWIDEYICLGALPTRRMLTELQAQGVGGAINMCREFRGHRAAMDSLNIEQLHLPTLDYHPPGLHEADLALAFIDRIIESGRKVYIHCKAGRARSATIVLCYLIRRYHISPEEALRRVKQKRPHVNAYIEQREVVQAIARQYADKRDTA